MNCNAVTIGQELTYITAEPVTSSARHERGVEVIVLDDGAIRFVKPNGQSFDSVIPGFTQLISDWMDIPAAYERAQIHINERTAATRWCGESMDYGLTVQVLVQQNAKRGDGVMR